MIVVDASVLIAIMDPADAHHEPALAVMTGPVEAGEDLAVSTVTLAEVLTGVAPEGVDQLRSHLEAIGLREVPLVAHDSAERLAILRVTTRLKLPDCSVLLAAEYVAQQSREPVRVATLDARLAAAARRAGFTTLP